MADYATLIYDIDSSAALGAAKALNQMERAAASTATMSAKLEKTFRNANGQFQSQAAFVAENASEIKRLASAYNPALSAQLKFADAQKEVARAVQLGVISSGQQADVLRQLTASYNMADAAASNFSTSQKNAAMQSSNVFAQLNDIGVMLAAGQNPFQLALQQGTQLNQVWASMGEQGKTLGGVSGMLRSAFSSMISPMNLLTIGVIAGSAALIQWAFDSGEAAKSADVFKEKLGGLATAAEGYEAAIIRAKDPMYSLVQEFGSQAQEAERLFDLMERIQRAEFFAQTSTLASNLKTEFEDLAWYVNRYNEVVAQGENKGPALERPIRQLREQYGLAMEDAIVLNNIITNMGENPGPLEAARALEDLSGILVTARENGGKVPPELIRTANEAIIAALRVQSLTGALDGAAAAAAGIVIPLGMTYGNSDWLSGLSGGDLLPPSEVAKPKRSRGGGGAMKQAEKQFQSLRELLEQESVFQVAEYEKRQAQLDNALSKKLLSEQKYNEMRAQLQMHYFGTEFQQNALTYSLDLEQLNAAFNAKLLSEEQYLMKRAQLQHDYYSGAIGVNQNQMSQDLSNMSAHFGQMNSLAGGGYDGLLRAQKAFAAGSALINAYLAASQAMADPTVPFWGKMAAYAKILAAGMGAVNAIKGAGSGGTGAGSAASAGAAKQEPTRTSVVRLTGDEWLVNLADNIMTKIYEASGDGRVIIQRDY